MAETHVVSALVDKRAEIAGQITRFEQQLGQFRADLTHVDATIRLFAPDLTPDTIPAKVIRRSEGWFASGEVKRTDVLSDGCSMASKNAAPLCSLLPATVTQPIHATEASIRAMRSSSGGPASAAAAQSASS
jgi:hypothetical protein